MLQKRVSRAACAALLAAMALASVTAIAKDGRDFAGYYSLTNVNNQGQQVRYAGIASVQLQRLGLTPGRSDRAWIPRQHGILGSFAPVKLWRSTGDIVLSQQLTMPPWNISTGRPACSRMSLSPTAMQAGNCTRDGRNSACGR